MRGSSTLRKRASISWATTTTSITITTASSSTAVKATTSEAAGTGYPWLGFAHNEPPPLVFVSLSPWIAA